MNYIRTKVSGKKFRYIDDKYNLDLTYVTPRIIAMAFPGSGFKSLYRNEIGDVGDFLRDKHNKHFIVFNLSGTKYDTSKFDGCVLDFDQWPDHYAPPIELLFVLVEKIHTFLSADEKNVIVVNCNAGKGRTGTLICCYLLFSGRFTDPQDAFDYYSLKRFNKGFGVTHASQKRYVNYFYQIVQSKKIPSPKLRYLKKLEVSCYPFFSGSQFYPHAEIFKKIKNIANIGRKSPIKINNENNDPLSFTFGDIKVPLTGDILIELYDKGLSKTKLGRISFNISFIEKDVDEYVFPLQDIDPYKFPIKNKVKDNYAIKLHFASYCSKCKFKDKFENYCEDCKRELWEEIAEYKHIQEFLSNYSINTEKASWLLFGESKDDVEQVLEKRSLLLTPKIDRRDKAEKDKEVKCGIY